MSTTNLNVFLDRHLERRHKAVYEAYRKSVQTTPPSGKSQLSVSDFLPKAQYGQKHPSQVKRTTSFINNVIINCNLPISLSEHPSFRQFVSDLDPLIALPSRRHVSSTLIPEQWDKKKASVHEIVSSARSVSLTVNIWTDRVMHSYLAVTAHTFVEFSPKSCLLKFAAFDGSHTGAHIAETMTAAIEEFALDEKVGTYIVSDNASNMRKAFALMNTLRDIREQNDNDDQDDHEFAFDDDDLGQDLPEEDSQLVQPVLERRCITRLSCFAHSIQLVVRDGTAKLPTATSVLAKVSKLANIVHQSALFRASFEQRFGTKSIPSTNATRWNSLHTQLKAVSELDQVKLADVLRDQKMHNLVLTQREQAALLELVEILDPFAEATDLCQGQHYTTIGCIVPCIVSLLNHLQRMEQHGKYHRPMVVTLRQSLDSRFAGMLSCTRLSRSTLSTNNCNKAGFGEDLYVIASALDPSYGFLWLEEDHPGDTETKAQLKDYITGGCHISLPLCRAHINTTTNNKL